MHGVDINKCREQIGTMHRINERCRNVSSQVTKDQIILEELDVPYHIRNLVADRLAVARQAEKEKEKAERERGSLRDGLSLLRYLVKLSTDLDKTRVLESIDHILKEADK